MAMYICLMNVKKYHDDLLPALRAFTERSERSDLQALIKEAVYVTANTDLKRPGFVDFPPFVYEEFGAILDDVEFYSRLGIPRERADQRTSAEDLSFFVTKNLLPSLFALLCPEEVEGLNPWQDVSDAELTSVLYERSRWVEDRLILAVELQGDEPEIVIGEWSRFLTREEQANFAAELEGMPESLAPETRSSYMNLQAICQYANNAQEAGLLACIV